MNVPCAKRLPFIVTGLAFLQPALTNKSQKEVIAYLFFEPMSTKNTILPILPIRRAYFLRENPTNSPEKSFTNPIDIGSLILSGLVQRGFIHHPASGQTIPA